MSFEGEIYLITVILSGCLVLFGTASGFKTLFVFGFWSSLSSLSVSALDTALSLYRIWCRTLLDCVCYRNPKACKFWAGAVSFYFCALPAGFILVFASLLVGLDFLSLFEVVCFSRLLLLLLFLLRCDLDLNQNTFSGEISLLRIPC